VGIIIAVDLSISRFANLQAPANTERQTTTAQLVLLLLLLLSREAQASCVTQAERD
jgi:hypothetical protein